MADVLRIKRRVSGAPGAPSTLANAEVAYNEVDHIMYYGEGTGGAGGTASTIVGIAGQGLASNVAPLMNGTAAAGSATSWSRSDHVHASDTSRAPLLSPNFSGTPLVPTAANGTNTQQAASTAYVLATRLDQLVAPANNVSMNSHTLTNLLDPVNPQDATTKNYVDNAIQGLEAKAPCVCATTGANLTLSGLQTIDGYTTVVGDRVLVKDQTAPAQNGIYAAATGTWNRTADMVIWAQVPSAYVFIEMGTLNADTGWLCTSNPGGTMNTTSITWVQFSAAGQITAGSGLQKVGNVISAVGTAGQISVGAAIGIDPTYVGQTSITTLGTVATGTWNAATIAVSRGGTGAVALTGYVSGNGTAAFSASATIPNTAITGLGTMSTQAAGAVAITGGTIDNVTFDMGTF